MITKFNPNIQYLSIMKILENQHPNKQITSSHQPIRFFNNGETKRKLKADVPQVAFFIPPDEKAGKKQKCDPKPDVMKLLLSLPTLCTDPPQNATLNNPFVITAHSNLARSPSSSHK